MSTYGALCPHCRTDALFCVSREGRTGSPCCWACREQMIQHPLHVWPRHHHATTEPEPTDSGPVLPTLINDVLTDVLEGQ